MQETIFHEISQNIETIAQNIGTLCYMSLYIATLLTIWFILKIISFFIKKKK